MLAQPRGREAGSFAPPSLNGSKTRRQVPVSIRDMVEREKRKSRPNNLAPLNGVARALLSLSDHGAGGADHARVHDIQIGHFFCKLDLVDALLLTGDNPHKPVAFICRVVNYGLVGHLLQLIYI